jgi:hypothetical protein
MRGQPRRPILNMSGGPRAVCAIYGRATGTGQGGTHDHTSSALAHVAVP